MTHKPDTFLGICLDTINPRYGNYPFCRNSTKCMEGGFIIDEALKNAHLPPLNSDTGILCDACVQARFNRPEDSEKDISEAACSLANDYYVNRPPG